MNVFYHVILTKFLCCCACAFPLAAHPHTLMADEEAQLLAASHAAYQRIAESYKQSSSDFVDGTNLVLLDNKQEKPHISATALKPKSKGKARADDPPELKPYLESVERDGVISQRKPTKRQIREHREKTAGKQWFDMPEFPGSRYASKDPRSRAEHGKSSYTGGDARAATEKEMRRQVVAIRLRNALDPKRYYRGGTGAEKNIPKYAQLGRIVGGGLEPASILTRKERAPSAVGEVTRDTDTRAYSKRKFDEVCYCR